MALILKHRTINVHHVQRAIQSGLSFAIEHVDLAKFEPGCISFCGQVLLTLSLTLWLWVQLLADLAQKVWLAVTID